MYFKLGNQFLSGFRNIFLAINFFFSLNFLVAQIQFFKQFSNNGYDSGEGVAQTEDGSYLITGSSSSFVASSSQAFLLKIDSLGIFLWSKHYGGSEIDMGKRVFQIENEGIFIAGVTNSSGAGAYDYYLIKTDLQGNKLWEKTYGTSAWERLHDAALTEDSGIIMVGETLNTSDGDADIFIVRTDKEGNELWSQQFGESGNDAALCIQPVDSATFLIGGKIFVADSSLSKGFVVKIEEDGVIRWSDTLEQSGASQINSIMVDSTFFRAVGQVTNQFDQLGYFYVRGTLADGDFYQFKKYHYNDSIINNTYFAGIVPFGFNNGYNVVKQYSGQYSSGGLDLEFGHYIDLPPFYLFSQQFNSIIRSRYDDILSQLVSTSDFGAIAVGTISDENSGGSNVFVLKLHPNSSLFPTNQLLSETEPLVTIKEIKDANTSWKVYPNPVASFVTVEFIGLENSGDTKIELYDQLGRLLYIQDTINGSQEVALENYSEGLYRLVLKSNQGVEVRMILLKK